MDIAAEMGFKGMEIQTGKANMPVLDIGTDTVPGIRRVLTYAEAKARQAVEKAIARTES